MTTNLDKKKVELEKLLFSELTEILTLSGRNPG